MMMSNLSNNVKNVTKIHHFIVSRININTQPFLVQFRALNLMGLKTCGEGVQYAQTWHRTKIFIPRIAQARIYSTYRCQILSNNVENVTKIHHFLVSGSSTNIGSHFWCNSRHWKSWIENLRQKVQYAQTCQKTKLYIPQNPQANPSKHKYIG